MAWNDPVDLLERATNASFLTDYLAGQYATNEKSNFVLAVDSAWGRGKTYFLNNWKQDLEEQGYPVVYFDAWANDFSDDPLVSLISELHTGLKPIYKVLPPVYQMTRDIKKTTLKVSKVGRKLFLNLLLKKTAGVSLEAINEYFDEEDIDIDSNPDTESQQPSAKAAGENIKALDKAIDELTNAAFKEHTSKKRAIAEFKKSVASLLDVIKNKVKDKQLPLFIFVDELDRCRPNFAVEVLEVVKHLFDVPGVYFVIATHIDQLAASINVLYGEKFDSRQYLKRFFHQEYVLPDPEPLKFVQYLYQQYRPFANLSSDQFFVLFEHPRQTRTVEQQVEAFTCLAMAFGLSLRDMEQCMVMLKAVCLSWKKNRQLHIFYMLFWIMLKHKNSDEFRRLVMDNRHVTAGIIELNEKNVFSPKSVIETYGGQTINPVQLVSFYYERRFWKRKDYMSDAGRGERNSYSLPGAIEIALDRESNNTQNPDDPLYFSHYPRLVEQAGQLHI